MDKFEYLPATLNADTVKMDGPSGFVGTAENVRSREWAREFGKRNLMSAARLAREVEVDFAADFETMDALREAADADLYNLTPGTFVAQGEWKLRGYVLQSMPKGVHFGWVSTALTLALLDGAWWRIQGVSLVPPSTDPPETRYGSGTGTSVRMGGAVNSEFTSLTIYGKSVQAGTPTPSSPIPVQVVESHNRITYYGKGAVSYGENNEISLNFGVTAGNVCYGPVKPNTRYTFTKKAFTGANRYRVMLLDFEPEGGVFDSSHYTTLISDNTKTGDYSYTFDSGAWTWMLAVLSTSSVATSADAQAQLEVGESATAYVPIGNIGVNFGGSSVSIDLDGNVLASLPDGTKDELTISSTGAVTLTKRIGVVDLGTKGWSAYSSGAGNTYRHNLTGRASGVTNMICDALAVGTDGSHLGDGQMAGGSGSAYVYARDDASADATAFKAAMDGVQLYYELATTQTITLDPVTLPTVTPNAAITVTAAVVPEVDAVFEPGLHSLTVRGNTISRLSSPPYKCYSYSGYNLLPFDKTALKSYNTAGAWNVDTYALNGVSATLNDNGTITLNGTATGSFEFYLCPNTNQITQLPLNRYTLTGEVPGTGSDSTWYFQATTTTDASGTVRATYRDYGAGANVIFDSSTYGVAVFFHASSGDTFANAVLKPQLVYGSTAWPFVPYGCLGLKVGDSVTPINLGGNILASSSVGNISNYRDVLSIDEDGNVTLTKRVKTVDLGSFTWEKVTIGNLNFRTTTAIADAVLVDGTSSTPNYKCDYFKENTYSSASASGDKYSVVLGKYAAASDRGKVCISYSDGSQMSADEFKAFVSGMTLYYQATQEQTIALDPITMPGISDNVEVSVLTVVSDIMNYRSPKVGSAVSMTAEWQLASYANYDYPHDYATDYQRPTMGGSVDTGRLVPCKPRITFFGPVVDPEITIAGNKYKVTASVASGARIEVDGKEKTVQLIAQDGTVTDKFADALRGSGEGGGEYIFEQIPPGTHDITWDATFGVDVQWYDEVGEPPWSLS